MRTTSTQAKAARIKAEGALATAEAVDDVAEVKMEELSGILLRKPRCGVMRRCKRGTGEIGAGPVFQEPRILWCFFGVQCSVLYIDVLSNTRVVSGLYAGTD